MTLYVVLKVEVNDPVTFFFQGEDGIRVHCVTGVQTCALPIFTIEHTVAKGGNGQDGGGGALGAGGGLFVANDTANQMAPGRVTLNNVVFNDDQAVGGDGSITYSGNGAGGGMGGDSTGSSGGPGPLGVGTSFGVGGDWGITTPRLVGGDVDYGSSAGYG